MEKGNPMDQVDPTIIYEGDRQTESTHTIRPDELMHVTMKKVVSKEG